MFECFIYLKPFSIFFTSCWLFSFCTGKGLLHLKINRLCKVLWGIFANIDLNYEYSPTCFCGTLWSEQFSDSLHLIFNQLFGEIGCSVEACHFFFSLRAEMRKVLPCLFSPSKGFLFVFFNLCTDSKGFITNRVFLQSWVDVTIK